MTAKRFVRLDTEMNTGLRHTSRALQLDRDCPALIGAISVTLVPPSGTGR
jgi:hypothetical protein